MAFLVSEIFLCFDPLMQRNVSLLLSPAGCPDPVLLLLLVSSGPANARQRDAWRAKLAGRSRTRAVFVVARARSPGQQQALELEHNQFGDLLQAGVQVSLYLWFSIS